MSPRLDYAQQSPELFKKYVAFSLATRQGSSVESAIHDLVQIRVSQLNGCAFCVDMHVKQARIRGERELRLHHLAIWRESPLFDARERAALAWAEALTQLDAKGIDDALYAALRAQFTDHEIVELSYDVMAINGWNRLNVAFRSTPGAQDAAFGLDKAGLA
ncbi:carboxymuconolactone decarboxylase family protein [Solimonas variicoloris]|uniref:carboxymuconolactone decarboxylase family protein n=1 Tax=Solimonas variicoloris TaxID=254408 RepID=UPI00037D05F0|nr:carboxymuconolactone decarboxylase family protein [Solimonas variicoloris]